ncbi:MAG: hypothetical protein HY207_03695 [Nitrospirae bacterium]|nr:hypothetical protein [Nitrospirota bacterium]
MASYISPAFLQQCFAMHRLDMVVRQLKGSGIIVSCRQCKIRHTVRLERRAEEREAVLGGEAQVFAEPLLRCAASHLPAIGVHAVDVVRDALDLWCAQCRETYPFRIIECVTRSV